MQNIYIIEKKDETERANEKILLDVLRRIKRNKESLLSIKKYIIDEGKIDLVFMEKEIDFFSFAGKNKRTKKTIYFFIKHEYLKQKENRWTRCEKYKIDIKPDRDIFVTLDDLKDCELDMDNYKLLTIDEKTNKKSVCKTRKDIAKKTIITKLS